MLREWYEGDEDAEQYEVPDIEGCTPKCLKEQPMSLRALKELGRNVADQEVNLLVSGVLELCCVSKQAKRPEFNDEMGEQLMDSNPPLPCLLAAFSSGDAVVGCFDDGPDGNGSDTATQPRHPLKVSGPAGVGQGFRSLGVVCETLAAASRLIDRMPGNDGGVITREERFSLGVPNFRLSRPSRQWARRRVDGSSGCSPVGRIGGSYFCSEVSRVALNKLATK